MVNSAPKQPPDQVHYRISEAILLLTVSMAPLLYWVLIDQNIELQTDIPPNAFVIVSILNTFALSYGLSVRLYPALGRRSLIRAEKWAGTYLKFGSLPMALVAIGKWPLDGPEWNRWLFLLYYGITVAHMFIVHFIVSFRMPTVDDEDSTLWQELRSEQLATIAGVHLVGVASIAAGVLSLLAYALFRYPSMIPNHATVFGVFFGIVFGLLVLVRTTHTENKGADESDSAA